MFFIVDAVGVACYKLLAPLLLQRLLVFAVAAVVVVVDDVFYC